MGTQLKPNIEIPIKLSFKPNRIFLRFTEDNKYKVNVDSKWDNNNTNLIKAKYVSGWIENYSENKITLGTKCEASAWEIRIVEIIAIG